MRSLPIMLLLLQRQQQQRHSPRLHLPSLCFPNLRASLASVPRASQVALQQAASQPLILSGAPACPQSTRRTLPTAPRVTPAGQPTVSFLLSTTPFSENVLTIVYHSGAIITTTPTLLENLFHEFIINPHPRSLCCIHLLFLSSTQFTIFFSKSRSTPTTSTTTHKDLAKGMFLTELIKFTNEQCGLL